MKGILLDTHTLYWLVSGEEPLSEAALAVIAESQAQQQLFISPISAWELALAARKMRNKPEITEAEAASWFSRAKRSATAKIAPIGQHVALQAAAVIRETGHKDPGDCFLIATARAKALTLVSRDSVILRLGSEGYVSVLAC